MTKAEKEIIDCLEDVIVMLKGWGDCEEEISAVRYAIAKIVGGE